jgi:hypothetical protein
VIKREKLKQREKLTRILRERERKIEENERQTLPKRIQKPKCKYYKPFYPDMFRHEHMLKNVFYSLSLASSPFKLKN